VLAVPGEITSQLSRGTNALLRLGAAPVTCAADVLDALGVEPPPAPAPVALAEPLRAICAIVGDGAIDPDTIVRSTGLASGVVAAALAELELLGLVTQSDGLYREVMRQT
jgi:DNA processing protein